MEQLLVSVSELLEFMTEKQYDAFWIKQQKRANAASDIKNKKMEKVFMILEW